MLEAAPGSGIPDTLSATEVSDFVVAAIDEMRWSDLAALAHPRHGVRFAPYGYVDTADTRRLSPDEVAVLGEDTQVRHWGTADGTGDPMDFTFPEYYSSHLYAREFRDAARGSPGEIIERGNSLVNIEEVFPWDGVTFVEYHVEGTEQYGGMDWGSLRVVLLLEDGRWYLIGLLNDRWTV